MWQFFSSTCQGIHPLPKATGIPSVFLQGTQSCSGSHVSCKSLWSYSSQTLPALNLFQVSSLLFKYLICSTLLGTDGVHWLDLPSPALSSPSSFSHPFFSPPFSPLPYSPLLFSDPLFSPALSCEITADLAQPERKVYSACLPRLSILPEANYLMKERPQL